jgi:hypothetical protein
MGWKKMLTAPYMSGKKILTSVWFGRKCLPHYIWVGRKFLTKCQWEKELYSNMGGYKSLFRKKVQLPYGWEEKL